MRLNIPSEKDADSALNKMARQKDNKYNKPKCMDGKEKKAINELLGELRDKGQKKKSGNTDAKSKALPNYNKIQYGEVLNNVKNAMPQDHIKESLVSQNNSLVISMSN